MDLGELASLTVACLGRSGRYVDQRRSSRVGDYVDLCSVRHDEDGSRESASITGVTNAHDVRRDEEKREVDGDVDAYDVRVSLCNVWRTDDGVTCSLPGAAPASAARAVRTTSPVSSVDGCTLSARRDWVQGSSSVREDRRDVPWIRL